MIMRMANTPVRPIKTPWWVISNKDAWKPTKVLLIGRSFEKHICASGLLRTKGLVVTPTISITALVGYCSTTEERVFTTDTVYLVHLLVCASIYASLVGTSIYPRCFVEAVLMIEDPSSHV